MERCTLRFLPTRRVVRNLSATATGHSTAGAMTLQNTNPETGHATVVCIVLHKKSLSVPYTKEVLLSFSFSFGWAGGGGDVINGFPACFIFS